MILAGRAVRLGAHLIDFILWNAVELALQWVVTEGFGLSSFTEQVVGGLLSLGILYGYYVELPVRWGSTPGKKLFGMVVFDSRTYLPMGRKQASIRLASYLVSYAVLGCGFLMVAFHPKRLGLHDLIAGTLTVRKR